jgi:Type IV secretory system Conjugative DNA transfer/Type IV secretion-system coupling protein DNA-binding domain
MTAAALLAGGGLVVLGVILTARFLEADTWRRSLQAMRLQLPAGLEVDDVSRWLATIVAATHAPRWSLLAEPPVAIEVVATRAGIAHVLLMPRRLRATVQSGVRAALPGARLTEDEDYLKKRPTFQSGAEIRLSSRHRPLATDQAEAVSTALLATLQPLHGTEQIVLQWTVTAARPARPVPSQPIPRDNTTRLLGDVVSVDSEAIRAQRLKQAAPLLQAVGRIAVTAYDKHRARRLLNHVFGQLRGMGSPGVRVGRANWLPSRVAGRRLQRLSLPVTGFPILLNVTELAGLAGIPYDGVALPGLTLGGARQLPPSADAPTTGVELAMSNYPGMQRSLRLTAKDRLQHVHLIGPTGVGKSTLIARMALQDIAAGHSVVVVDPKSDLCAEILARLPEDRAEDVIVLDPSRTDQPTGFNILRAGKDEQDRELIVDHVIHIWHELYRDFWGPRSEDALRAALLTLINTRAPNGQAFTLIEVPELLVNPGFRRFVLAQSTVPTSLAGFWDWYTALGPLQRQQVIGPIQNKLRSVTLRTSARLLLGQDDGLDLQRLIGRRQVLLAPLSKGVVGSETASLIGTLLVSSLWQAILGRAALPPERRRPVMVYLDEMQDVLRLPVELADMLAQARGLGAAFHLAHQHLGQVTNREVKAALLGTVRSRVIFQLGLDDAKALAPTLAPHLTADDLRGLPAFEIALHPTINNATRPPVTGATLPLDDPTADPEAVALASRQRYGSPRADVEADLAARIAVAPASPTNTADSSAPSSAPPIGRRMKSKSHRSKDFDS